MTSSLRNNAGEVRAFFIGRAGWKEEPFLSVFNSSLEQVYRLLQPFVERAWFDINI
jgi:hypothetical protein